MANQRCWTWIDDNAERSEESTDDITPTLNALATEWSQIRNEIEAEGFARQARYEDGDCGPEDPECPHCDGQGYLGQGYRYRGGSYCINCGEGPANPQLVFILCPWCQGEGIDKQRIAERDNAIRQRHANREVRREIIEEMLARYGARMMRPYEHWNEDERYMEYMECGRFGDDLGY